MATSLVFSYAVGVCALLTCGELGVLAVKVPSMAGMVVASCMLLLRVYEYESIDSYGIRGYATISVVVAACMHTVIQDVCPVFFGGACGSVLSITTGVLWGWVGTVTAIKPRAIWPVSTSDAAGWLVLTGKVHTGPKIDAKGLFVACLVVLISTMSLVWVLDVAAWLFKPEMLTALVVSSFGPLIAFYFANSERNKRIDENHTYKTRILIDINSMLDLAVIYIQEYLTAQPSTGLNVDKMDHVKFEYQYQRGHIVALNTNTYVPVQTRDDVDLLVGGLDLLLLRHTHLPEGPSMLAALKGMSEDIDMFLSPAPGYFAADRNVNVQRAWGKAMQNMSNVRDAAAKLIAVIASDDRRRGET